MLNMIDIGERAGSGIPNIYRVWHDQHWAEPTFIQSFEPDRTTLSLLFSKGDEKTVTIKTTDMQKNAANAIERGLGNTDMSIDESAVPRPKQHERKVFKPKESKCRESGTGGVYQLNDHLYEGRFTPRLPDGKRKGFNVYAQTREECEKKLAEMIVEVKAKIAAEKVAMKR